MGGSDGMDVLRTTRALHPTTAVILMTAFGSVNTAVEAMKIGAFDYVQKPFEIEEMEVKIEKALEVQAPEARARLPPRHAAGHLRLRHASSARAPRSSACSTSCKKVAKSNTTVLIRGETGTGKELIAGAIHHNSLRDGAQLRQGELRGAAGEPARVGTLRPREGRVHRRRQAAHRPLRAGRRRHAVPRRNRRHEPEHAGEDPARAAGARVRAPRRHAHAARRRAADRRDQPRSAGDGAGGPVPRGPVLPPQRRLDRDAAAARAQGRHRAAGACRSSAGSPAS